MKYAKKVKHLIDELGICTTIDRTKEKHRYPFDVDVRKPSAPPDKRYWIYWGSHRTVEACRAEIKKYVKRYLGQNAQARIVEARTGKIIEIIK